MNKIILTLLISIFLISSCENDNIADAYGNFEAIETIISSQSNGTITNCFIEEGNKIKKGDTAYITDSYSLELQKLQILSKKNAMSAKFSGIIAQVNVINQQKEVLLKEKNRIYNLLQDSAATQKQFDDITGKINILNKQIEQVKTQNKSLFEELKVFDTQLKLNDNLINKTIIINPISGTILTKYARQNEIAMLGKPLYKIADLSKLILRTYISGIQLNDIKIGQKVDVFIDKTKNENKKYTGTISWISSKAEFTPKVIQTKEERVNLVYAVKIKVKNDGGIKIGMPGEVRF